MTRRSAPAFRACGYREDLDDRTAVYQVEHLPAEIHFNPITSSAKAGRRFGGREYAGPHLGTGDAVPRQTLHLLEGNDRGLTTGDREKGIEAVVSVTLHDAQAHRITHISVVRVGDERPIVEPSQILIGLVVAEHRDIGAPLLIPLVFDGAHDEARHLLAADLPIGRIGGPAGSPDQP